MHIVKFPGGKSFLAARIVAMMRPHTVYAEPFLGGSNVFFEKMYHRPTRMSFLSDLNPELINLWEQIRDYPSEFQKVGRAIPYGRKAFHIWKDNARVGENPFMRAMRYFLLLRMSRSADCENFSESHRQRNGLDEGESAWLSALDAIPQASAMLQWSTLACCDWRETFQRIEDQESGLVYLDPPYLHATRVDRDMYGNHEMTEAQHVDLLNAITHPSVKCKVILSGYDSPMYRAALGGWTLIKVTQPNRMSQGEKLSERTECLWRNWF